MDFHLLILNITNGRNFLGIVMAIPLISVVIYQSIINKMKIFHTFGLKKPKLYSIVFAIVFPLVLGSIFQAFFYFTKQEYFLFAKLDGIFLLLIVSLSISMISALLEEFVWRGNFYYYLRKKYTLWQTAIITALVWSLWHLPIALFYKNYEILFLGTFSYIGILFILSIMLTYIRAWGKSVLPAAILHGMFNGFYFTSGLNISWNLEYIETAEFLLLILVFEIMCLIYRLKKDNK